MAKTHADKRLEILREMATGTPLASRKPRPGLIIKSSMPCPCGPTTCHLSVLVDLYNEGLIEFDGTGDEDWHYYQLTEKGKEAAR